MTSTEVLGQLGAAVASDIVIAINDPDATLRATRAARRVAPKVRITVRTAYETDVKRLREAGATYVIAAESAAAGVITTQVLSMLDNG